MKKMLSVVLAAMMLMGLVFALPAQAAEAVTVSDSKIVTMEYEDYASDITAADGTVVGGAGWIASGPMLSGGFAIRTGSGPKQNVTIPMPISVETAGTYEVETALSYAGHLSILTLYLDDTEVQVFNQPAEALPFSEGNFYFGSKDYIGYRYHFSVELPEGDHELKLVAGVRAPQFNGGDTAFAADYITIKGSNVQDKAVPVTGLDTVRMEFEDHTDKVYGADGATLGGAGWVLSNQFMSGGKGLRTGSGPKQDVYITIPVNVKIGGTYELEAVVTSASWLSALSLMIDGNVVKQFDTSGTALPCEEDNYYFTSKDWPGYRYGFEVELSKGIHEISLFIKQRAEQFNGGDTAFAADYIQLKNKGMAQEAVISATESTRLEMENYIGSTLSDGEGYADAEVISHEKASGGKLYSVMEKPLKDIMVMIPVHVEKAGVYDLDMIMSYSADNNTSIVNLLADGERLVYNRYYQRDGLSDAEHPFVDDNFPMYHFYRRIYLSEGEHSLQVQVNPAEDGRVKFIMDCLTITPAEYFTLSETETATVEFEDYAKVINSAGVPVHGKNETAPNQASGGDYIYSYGAGADETNLILPITAPVSGVYNVEYIIAAASHLSPITATLDQDERAFHTNTTGGTSLDTEEAGYFHHKENLPAKKFTFPMYLAKGEHAITFRIPARLANNQMSVAYAMDCIRFTKQAGEVIPADGITIEPETYKNQVLVSGNVSGNGIMYSDMQYTAGVCETKYASGGAYMDMAERTQLERAKVYIPVVAETDGWYDLEWQITNADQGAYLSLVTLSLDGKELLINRGENLVEDLSVYDEENNRIYPSKWYPMGKFKTQVHIPAGEHIFTMDAQKILNFTDGHYGVKFQADAIRLTPIVGLLGSGASFTESDDHTGADWKFELISANKEGVLAGYVASYQGNRLVSVEENPLTYISGENTFSGKAVAAPGVDKMKFFVWDENGVPYADTEPVTFMPVNEDPFAGDKEINVVFIGDSIYEGAGASSNDTKWVSRVGKWFEETYEKDGVTVNWYNEGVGGSTTDYSLVRMFRDVLAHKPDVVFYSCSCNDVGDTRRNMESFLLTLMEQDQIPYVIFNRTTNRSFSTTNGRGDQIAKHYGIPFVDDYYAFKRAVNESGDGIATYFTDDGVHPNDKGYKVIADEMIACVSSGRYFRKPVNPGTKIIENSVAIEQADFLSTTSSDVTKTGSWTTGDVGKERGYVHSTQVGDTLEFTFTGNMLAFEHGLHDPAGKYEVYVDGNLAMTCNPQYNGITSYFHFVCKADTVNLDLPDGTHQVLVKTVPGDKTTDATYAVRIFNIITGNVKR